jgi:signal transduction histidine kinase
MPAPFIIEQPDPVLRKKPMPQNVVLQDQASPVIASRKIVILAAIPKSRPPCRLAEELEHVIHSPLLLYAETAQRLHDMAAYRKPDVIVIDDRILGNVPLAEALAEFAATVPVVLVAPYHRQLEVAALIAGGDVEFAPRADQWEQFAARLVERRLRWIEDCRVSSLRPSRACSEDLGEIFRHEINNPLTGILGNAELLLAHSDRFSAIETQRIRTVVDLAVRLRETVRRVSNLWEKQLRSRSA